MKRRRPPVVIKTNYFLDRDLDAVFSAVDGNVVVFEAKPGFGKTEMALRQAEFYESLRNEELLSGSVRLEIGIDLPGLNAEPPQFADFLLSLIPAKHRETLLGDLEEDYWTRFLPKHGLRKARICYTVQATYAILAFLARPLFGIAGIASIGKLMEALISRIVK